MVFNIQLLPEESGEVNIVPCEQRTGLLAAHVVIQFVDGGHGENEGTPDSVRGELLAAVDRIRSVPGVSGIAHHRTVFYKVPYY